MSDKEDIKEEKSIEESENVDDVTFENQEEKEPKPETGTKKKASSPRKSSKSKSSKTIEELKKKNEELNDRYLRLYSEFDNYRKRTSRERIELQKSASKALLIELLPILDDFERAIKAFEDHHLSSEAKKGIELIYTKLMTSLKQKGLEPMEEKGEVFDTDFREAITEIPAPTDNLKGKVVDVVQKGYLLNGKVVRYAKVVVGK